MSNTSGTFNYGALGRYKKKKTLDKVNIENIEAIQRSRGLELLQSLFFEKKLTRAYVDGDRRATVDSNDKP
jgi:hypothetical protein